MTKAIIKVFGSVEKEVTEENIITLFQTITKLMLFQTEDSGGGMRTLWIDENTYIQVYPNNEWHNVYINKYESELAETISYELKDFAFDKQVEYLLKYYNTLVSGYRVA